MDEPLNELRYIRRKIKKETSTNPLYMTDPVEVEIIVLQQKWIDGWGQNTYWQDVPIVEE